MLAASGSSDDGSNRWRVRWREWLLLDGPRHQVTAVTVAAILLIATVLTASDLVPLRDVQPLYYVFGGMVSGNLTVITVVVTINQLLLSRELHTPDELRSQIEGVIDYREEIRDAVDQVPPPGPLGFLRVLVESLRQEAGALDELSAAKTDEEVYGDIEPIVSDLTENTDDVEALLRTSNPSTFEVLSTTLATNFAREVTPLNRVLYEFDDTLPEDVRTSIQRLVDHLENLDIARQYFKSIYLEEELASLSRQLFFVGLTSLLVVTIGLLLLTAPGGASIPKPYLPQLVSVVITAGLAPISLLFAYVLRLATVSKRTAAILPFTTPAHER